MVSLHASSVSAEAEKLPFRNGYVLFVDPSRDSAGRTWGCLGKKVLTGRGEGSSGVRFDVVREGAD